MSVKYIVGTLVCPHESRWGFPEKYTCTCADIDLGPTYKDCSGGIGGPTSAAEGLVIGDGSVLRQDGSIRTAAEGLVVAMTQMSCALCHPAGGTFNGYSNIFTSQSDPFETCFQYGDEAKYCWTKSYRCIYRKEDNMLPFLWLKSIYYPCIPNGDDAWHSIDAKNINPVTDPNSCGMPCPAVHHVNPNQ